MSTTVFLIVLGAALLHAGWNALLKSGGDKFAAMTAVSLGHVPLASLAALLLPLPAPESWPWLLGGLALHVAYQTTLTLAYRAGDLSHVYPIARGSAPLIVALVSVTALGVHLTGMELMGVAIIGTGILSLALVRKSDGRRNPRAAALALLTGCFIAGYSLVDGLGARLSGSPVAFFGWQAIGTALVFAVLINTLRPGTVRGALTVQKWRGLIGGAASFVAFAMVMWAFTQAPIALVTALRETSIVFALLIGVIFMGERLDLAKLVSTFTALAGAALLRFARHM
ncbi:EamA family transporter [Roseovarius sp. SCSIO 43702]|uniref:EamA family transporter n=1 Tax=Roseovarius sp. SCSIO 43702 TaxID=2823043 RepID=UPI001C738425|nr:EamA family transporter [Roseovarius sp. SCSIO 43702]QYX56476.1 EamA family transporter [Roseovarius sp. SCSIO 43702]